MKFYDYKIQVKTNKICIIQQSNYIAVAVIFQLFTVIIQHLEGRF